MLFDLLFFLLWLYILPSITLFIPKNNVCITSRSKKILSPGRHIIIPYFYDVIRKNGSPVFIQTDTNTVLLKGVKIVKTLLADISITYTINDYIKYIDLSGLDVESNIIRMLESNVLSYDERSLGKWISFYRHNLSLNQMNVTSFKLSSVYKAIQTPSYTTDIDTFEDVSKKIKSDMNSSVISEYVKEQ